MKNAVIFHGTDDKPGNYWYKWLADELEKPDYRVVLPYYPTINHEPIETFLPKVLNDHNFDSETVLLGHSASAPLILSILENISTKIAQATLVAGYSERPDDQIDDPILQKKYDWQKIRQNVGDITFINSVEDPWNCDATQGRIMFDNLGGTQIIRNEGHFGSGKFNQPYPTFPLLKALVLGVTA